MLRLLLPFAALSVLACSGSNFELPLTADTGGASQGEDSGSTTSDDALASDDAAPADDGGSSTTPPCNTTPPPPACPAVGTEYAPQFQYASSAELTPLVDHNTQHAISYVIARSGRHQKMILTLRKKAAGGPNVGRLTLTAFYTPCEGVHLPLGKSRSLDANTVYDGNVSFYFADDATYLPAFPAGTRLTFVLSTDSTAYNFELIGSATGAAPPAGLKWWVKKGTSDWQVPGPELPNASPWLTYCPG